MWSHQERDEGQDHLPQPDVDALPNGTQDTVDLLAPPGSWTGCCAPEPPGPSPQSCFQADQPSACIGTQGYCSPEPKILWIS